MESIVKMGVPGKTPMEKMSRGGVAGRISTVAREREPIRI